MPPLEFVDLFCGAGGLSLGLRQAGLVPRLGVDTSADAIQTYHRNFSGVPVLCADVESLNAERLRSFVTPGRRFVLAGGPPCQLFSRLQRTQSPTKEHVIFRYLSLVGKSGADYVVFENVPRITTFSDVWPSVTRRLARAGYRMWFGVVPAGLLGVAQKRKRLVAIGAKFSFSEPSFPLDAHVPTVRDAIGGLCDLSESIPNHVTMNLSPENLRRIRSIKSPGGKSRDDDGSFSDSYARMAWDEPSPTITTKCVSFSNGRFGHPTEHRAITVREAARLQGFPDDFVFSGSVLQTAKQVGNAVPPPVARWLGSVLRDIDAKRPKLNAVLRGAER